MIHREAILIRPIDMAMIPQATAMNQAGSFEVEMIGCKGSRSARLQLPNARGRP